jgi:hypothetical protein
MFRKCADGHDEVRWATLATDPDHCWYCGAVGQPHIAITITSDLPPFPPDSPADRVARWAAA